ncbi:MAG TPA: histidine kinase dimerization/phospho-acceptor domain-containing protein, partial [Candidatus Dormibacteraeota bacterium]
MSLRTRLLVGVIALVIIGLAASGVATYLTLENSLLSRLDAQLTGGRVEATAALNGSQRGGPSPTRFPTDTVVERIRGDDVVDAKVSTPFGSTPSSARPLLPHSYPSHATDTPVKPFTVAGTGDIEHFRMTYWPEDSLDGDIVVLAIPMTDVDVTLGQLLFLELAIGSGIVIATAILAFAIINVGLRPLQRMGAVAGEIAAGDYSRRVEPATPLTEIGRLGLALNAMLAEIESAFAHRTASEQRLRRFIADASHELRTPLTSIRGYSEMLRRGAGESPEDASLARRRIEEESVRMSALVDDMLLIARLDQGRPIESK